MNMFAEIAFDAFKENVLKAIDQQISNTTDEQALLALRTLRATISKMYY